MFVKIKKNRTIFYNFLLLSRSFGAVIKYLLSKTLFFSVRVKGGMSLRNGMWHGLRNDIIMRHLIYAAE